MKHILITALAASAFSICMATPANALERGNPLEDGSRMVGMAGEGNSRFYSSLTVTPYPEKDRRGEVEVGNRKKEIEKREIKNREVNTQGTPIYAIKPDGDMLFYKHAGFKDGSPNWPIQALKIGNGWNFKQVFAGDNGAVYAIQDNGDMLFYKHAGVSDGSPNWPIQAAKIGNGWNFQQLFASGN